MVESYIQVLSTVPVYLLGFVSLEFNSSTPGMRRGAFDAQPMPRKPVEALLTSTSENMDAPQNSRSTFCVRTRRSLRNNLSGNLVMVQAETVFLY